MVVVGGLVVVGVASHTHPAQLWAWRTQGVSHVPRVPVSLSLRLDLKDVLQQ